MEKKKFKEWISVFPIEYRMVLEYFAERDPSHEPLANWGGVDEAISNGFEWPDPMGFFRSIFTLYSDGDALPEIPKEFDSHYTGLVTFGEIKKWWEDRAAKMVAEGTPETGLPGDVTGYPDNGLAPPRDPIDMVEQPPHYRGHPSGKECIDITEHFNFCRGNAIKYLWRAGKKGNEIEDLKKAKWYVEREIKRLQMWEAGSGSDS